MTSQTRKSSAGNQLKGHRPNRARATINPEGQKPRRSRRLPDGTDTLKSTLMAPKQPGAANETAAPEARQPSASPDRQHGARDPPDPETRPSSRPGSRRQHAANLANTPTPARDPSAGGSSPSLRGRCGKRNATQLAPEAVWNMLAARPLSGSASSVQPHPLPARRQQWPSQQSIGHQLASAAHASGCAAHLSRTHLAEHENLGAKRRAHRNLHSLSAQRMNAKPRAARARARVTVGFSVELGGLRE
jgi:hypothetical protein